jgi:hypothetical protein
MQRLLQLAAMGLPLSLCLSAAAVPRYVDGNSPGATAPYTTWATAATNIQDAVDAAAAGDTILVTNGVYATGGRTQGRYVLTNRVVIDKVVTVQSVNGPAVTLIQGYQVPGTITGDAAVRCVFLTNGAVLSGFTLTNGATRGASGDPKEEQPGGGAYCVGSSSVISNCVLAGNVARFWGGGAIYGSLYNCVITNNSALSSGGGTYFAKLYNCLVVSNTTSGSGGGAVRGTLNNCTLVGNSATSYAGGFDGDNDGTLNNCIVYWNTAPRDANYYRGTFYPANSFNYCCTVPYSTNGLGNFTNEPAFLNVAAGDYHLQAASPCINAGKNAYVTGPVDLDGNPRIAADTVDLGAYEVPSPASRISYAWLQQYGLPSDGSADSVDSDGDGLNNWQEWCAGTIPTNAASVLKVLTPTHDAAGLVVTWQSVAGKKYLLQRATDLSASPGFLPVASNIPGQLTLTGYTDTNATGPGPFFYRVGVQP